MSASFVSRVFEFCSESSLISKTVDVCYEAFDGFHSGDWGEKLDLGLDIQDESFSEAQFALEYLEANCEKFGPLIAVSVINEKEKYWLVAGLCSD